MSEIIIYKTTKHFRLRTATEKERASILYRKGNQLVIDQTIDNGKTYTNIARLTPRSDGVGYNIISIEKRLFTIENDSILNKELSELKYFADTEI